MLPANIIYPEFIPDQLLTADHLNNLFGYLDEQGRMTRTNLIGIGIVCGLKVITAADRSTITITEGCGVTSEGYLISFPEITYDIAVTYDPVKPVFYESFVNTVAKTSKVTLWELTLTAGTGQTAIDLNAGFLGNKKVLLFVELLEEENKNCDPNSCDDKGKNITVNLRALLISETDADELEAILDTGDKDLVNAQSFNALAEMKMPRFDVPNTNPVTTEDIFEAYQSVLTAGFLTDVNTLLTGAHTAFLNIIRNEYPGDPFEGMAAAFDFLHDGTITKNNLIHIQYYYDFFADLLQAYDEFRKTGTEMLSTCCPDPTLFPRHLLLGEAIAKPETERSDYRHYFIYSPLFDRKDVVHELRGLFKRLVLMKENFFLPAVSDTNTTTSGIAIDGNIRITPSTLGNVQLSSKAIPYYYRPKTGSLHLYNYWNIHKTLLGKAGTNLSYNADLYGSEKWVLKPLAYDLEPYNFFRVEGIIGKPFASVLSVLSAEKSANRLPFDVIALRTGEINYDAVDFSKTICAVSDLEIAYDITRREYEAIIGLSIEWLNKNRGQAIPFVNTGNDQRLEKFIGNMLQPVKKFLVDDLTGFISDYPDFIELYEDIEVEAVSIRDMLVIKLNNSDTQNTDFLEDLIDHFDEIIMAANKGSFRAVYQAFMQRFTEIYGAQFFGYYTDKNPGIQHKAGVPAGGTFIIVYHVNDAVAAPGEIVAGPISTRTDRRFATAKTFTKEKAKPAATAKTKDIGSLVDEISLLKNQGAGSAVLEAKLKEFMAAAAASPAAAPGAIAAALAAPPDIIKTIKSGTVIADFYLPYLCCSECPPIQYTVQPPPPNEPPVAVAISNFDAITIGDGRILELDGRNSHDPENLAIKTYAWSLSINSPGCNILNPAGDITQVTELIPGLYEFRLVVTDQEDAVSAPATVRVNVTAPVNQVPLAVATSNVASFTLGDGTELELDGTGSSDPEGGTITYAWTVATGSPACSISDAAAQKTGVTGIAVAGSYGFILVVQDQQGAFSAPASVTVTVNPANQPPVAVAESNVSQIILGGETGALVLVATNSFDPEGGPVTYSWVSDTSCTIVNPSGVTTVVSDLIVGVYTFTLVVQDQLGTSSAPATVSVTVLPPPNQRPVAVAASNVSTIVIGGGVELRLDGTGSFDPEGGDLTFAWSIPPTSLTCTIQDASAKITPVTDLTVGTYTFMLTVTDVQGAVSLPSQVSVLATPVPGEQKVCSSLQTVITAFNGLPAVDTTDNFNRFIQFYNDFPEVDAFYREMQQLNIAAQSPEKQVEFFFSKSTAGLLVKWINGIGGVILESFELRRLGLAMLNIHAQLTYFIACIQAEDVNAAAVPMQEPLQAIQAVLERIGPLLPNFTPEQREMLKQLFTITEQELNTLVNNGEANSKPLCVEVFNKIMAMLAAMPI